MRYDAVMLCIMFAVAVGFFLPGILRGRIPVPTDTLIGLYYPWRDLYAATNPRGVPYKNFLITDPVRQQIPWRKIAVDDLKSGTLPLWNPYAFSGTSLIGNIQSGALYPLNILFFLFPFPEAWTALIVLTPLLAGFFLYLFLRNTGISPPASFLGAAAWSFCGFSVAWLTWGTIVHTALWIPLILLSADNLFAYAGKKRQSRNKAVWFMVLAGSLACQFFAGHSQVFLYAVLVEAAYVLARIWLQRKFLKTSRVQEGVLTVATAASIAVLLTLFQWLPVAEFISVSSRVLSRDQWMQSGWFLPWQNLLQFLAPDFFGNPATMNYWGVWNYGEFVGYIGIIPLIFAFYAALRVGGKRVWFWVAGLLAALLLMLPDGISSLPYRLHIPVWSVLQPTRLMVVVDFSLAVLAVIGFDVWLKKRDRAPAILAVLFGAALLLLFLVTKFAGGFSHMPNLATDLLVSRRNLILPAVLTGATLAVLLAFRIFGGRKFISGLLSGALLVLVVFDLFRFAGKFTPFTPRSYFFPETPVLLFLEKQPKPFRVASLDPRLLPPNTAGYYGIEDIGGYDPLYFSRYEELAAVSERGKPDVRPPFGFNRIITFTNTESPVFPLFGARYVLSLEELHKPYLRKVFSEGQTIVYEDSRALPRVYLAREVDTAETGEKALARMFRPGFISGYGAVVEGVVPVLSLPIHSDEHVVLASYTDAGLTADVSVAVPRLLVIGISFLPGWRAAVDGKGVPVYRTNYLYAGVVVPAGRHTVSYRISGL
ncbi:YfhO family protein [Patescibacteria group bacterium]|nr:YfhO family protein [Patescibacteria group bacterium]